MLDALVLQDAEVFEGRGDQVEAGSLHSHVIVRQQLARDSETSPAPIVHAGTDRQWLGHFDGPPIADLHPPSDRHDMFCEKAGPDEYLVESRRGNTAV